MTKNSIQNQISLIAFVIFAPSFAFAQVSMNIETQKQMLIGRLYQATYGAHERCKPLKDESIKLDVAIDKYRAAFPELFAQMDKSPYLPAAREHFKKMMEDPEIAPVSDEELKGECTYIESLVTALTSDQSGKQSTIDIIQTLKK